MGSNPIRATDRVVIGRYAVRFSSTTLLCCGGSTAMRLLHLACHRRVLTPRGPAGVCPFLGLLTAPTGPSYCNCGIYDNDVVAVREVWRGRSEDSQAGQQPVRDT